MACCGGGSSPSLPNSGKVTPSSATAQTATKWVVTYPNDAKQEFWQEWAAHQALAISGGVLERIDPEPPVSAAQTGDHDTA
jgi:hypothetical protein